MNPQTTEQAVIVPLAKENPNQTTTRLALFDEGGNPIDLTSTATDTPTGSDIQLTGLTDETAAPITDDDTVNSAIAKIQARLIALETATP